MQAISCDYASVVLVAAGRRLEIVALTHPELDELCQSQIEANAGPLITAIHEGQLVSIHDVLAEPVGHRTGSSGPPRPESAPHCTSR